MKPIKYLLSLMILAFSVPAFSSGVMMDMLEMKRQVNALMQAETAQDFQQSAENFLTAAKKAQSTMPRSLDDDQERFKGYQAGMQDVIDVVNAANEQAKQGNLAEAKKIAERLDSLRKQYHREYK